jgi:lysophospholipase L1-like esterase
MISQCIHRCAAVVRSPRSVGRIVSLGWHGSGSAAPWSGSHGPRVCGADPCHPKRRSIGFGRALSRLSAFVWLVGMVGGLPFVAGCERGVTATRLTIDRLERIDPSIGVKDEQGKLVWYDAQQLPVEGKGWTETEAFYDRLPAKAKGVVRDGVWGLARDSAGLCVRFVTDSDRIAARWTVTSPSLGMDHMPATGVSGLDLYVNDGGRWRWLAVGRAPKSPTNEVVLAEGIPAGAYEYLLYLPLYNGVKSLQVGVASNATLARAPQLPPDRRRPICFYGTSITQGGCASRPGMVYTAILGRRLNRAVINLGFSGNGRMDPELATLLGEIDAAAYVLDCLPNMTADTVKERVVPFVESLRKARPETPIILVENLPYQYTPFLPKPRQQLLEKNQALHDAYQRLAAGGVRRLTYVPGDSLVGDDGQATVDGVHLTDLGFLRFADALEPVLRRTLDTR